jgi:hypothetical protein
MNNDYVEENLDDEPPEPRMEDARGLGWYIILSFILCVVFVVHSCTH